MSWWAVMSWAELNWADEHAELHDCTSCMTAYTLHSTAYYTVLLSTVLLYTVYMTLPTDVLHVVSQQMWSLLSQNSNHDHVVQCSVYTVAQCIVVVCSTMQYVQSCSIHSCSSSAQLISSLQYTLYYWADELLSRLYCLYTLHTLHTIVHCTTVYCNTMIILLIPTIPEMCYVADDKSELQNPG